MAQSALTAWAGYSNILNAAQQNPTAKDWTADVRTYTADPAAEQFLTSLASLVTAEVHAEGDVINENPQVTMIDGNRVIIISCVDSTNRRAVDTSGTQVMEPDPNPRVLSTAAVTDYGADNGGWLVREVNQVSPVTPC